MRSLVVMCGMMLGAATVVAGSADPLTFLGFQRDMFIDGASDVAFSADGRHVYVVSNSDDAVSIFSRDATTGLLSWVAAVRPSDVGDFVIDSPRAAAVSPDGGTVYVVGQAGLAVFERSATTGRLTYLESFRDGDEGVTTLSLPWDVVVSPDDRQVLVVAHGDDSLTVFDRDRTTGRLTLASAFVDGVSGVDGLDGASGVTLSPEGGSVYVTSLVDDAVAVFGREPVTGTLTFCDVYKESYVGISGLGDARGVVVSADGANVYVVGSTLDTVAVFQRNQVNGLLTFVHHLQQGSGGIRGLFGVRSLAASPDGAHLYTVSEYDKAIAVFARSPVDGSLSQLAVVESGDQGIDFMEGLRDLAITTDGLGLMVVDVGAGVLAFSREAAHGALTVVDLERSAPGLEGPVGVSAEHAPCVVAAGALANDIQSMRRQAPRRALDTVGHLLPFAQPTASMRSVVAPRQGPHVYYAGHDSDDIVWARTSGASPCLTDLVGLVVYANNEDGVVGLIGPQHLTLSPDEKNLYVAAEAGDAVVIFSRDSTDGSLTWLGTAFDGIGGIDGLDGAYWVEVSPDGAHLYVAGYSDNAVAVLSRDPATGHLSFRSVVRDGVAGVDGLAGVSSVVVSPDGAHVYAAGRTDDAVAIFARNPSTGALTHLGRVVDGVSGVDGLNGARALAVSPDGEQVYAVGQHDDALAVFSRDAGTGLLTQVGLHVDGVGGVDGLDTANGIDVSPDGVQVYVTGFSDNAIATFVRSELVIFDDGFDTGSTGQWSAATTP